MTRILLTVAFALMSATNSGAGSGDTYVYICTGSSSARYHKTSTCKGLKKCSKEIKKITLDEAKKMNRTPCGYCYKKK